MKRIWAKIKAAVAPSCPLTDDEWRTTYGGEPPTPGVRAERPRLGSCPGCGAGEMRWCIPGCPTDDPLDYR